MGAQRFSLISLVLSGLWLTSWPTLAQKRVLTLQQCIDEGVQNNLGYQIEKLNFETNLINTRQAQFSRLPSLNLNGNHSYSFGRSVDPFTNQFINQTIQSNNFSANLNFPLWAGFQVTNNVKRYKALAQVKQFQNEKLKNDLILNIINGFLSVVTNKLIYSNTELRLSQSREQLGILQKQYAAGRVAYAEIDRYNAQILTEQLNLATTNQNLLNSLLSLKYLVLKDVNEDIDIDVPEIIEPDSSILKLAAAQVEEEAFQRLPEIKAANENIRASDYSERVARGALYPTLTFNAQAYTGYSDARKKFVQSNEPVSFITLLRDSNRTVRVPTSLFENTSGGSTVEYPFGEQVKDNISQAVSFQLNIPIFNGLRNRSTLDAAKVSTRVARLTLDNTKRTASQQIRSAYLTAQTNKARYHLSKRQVAAQRLVYSNAQKRFEAGRANSFETTTEKNNLTVAENDLLRTTIDYLYSIKLLEFYTGRLQP